MTGVEFVAGWGGWRAGCGPEVVDTNIEINFVKDTESIRGKIDQYPRLIEREIV
jgi:hypothetical protein